MAKWVIKVIGKERKEIDKHLVVQAILALGRQLNAAKKAREQQSSEGDQ